MKRTIIIGVLLISFAVQGWGQSVEKLTTEKKAAEKNDEKKNTKSKYFITEYDIVVEEIKLTDSVLKQGRLFIARAGTKFTDYGIKNNKRLIKFWNYTNKEQYQPEKIENISDDYVYVSSITNDRYFLMDSDDFNEKTSNYYGKRTSFVWGLTVVPIKLRFKDSKQPFRFNNGFSLGVNAGFEYGIKGRKEQAWGFLLGLSVSTVDINTESVYNNYIDKSVTAGAFTPSLGVYYSFESFQIGAFLGADFVSGGLGANWHYQGKPWLGLGLGFGIFQKNKTADSETQKQ